MYDYEEEPLVGQSNTSAARSQKNNTSVVNRIMIIVTMVILVIISITLEMQQVHLTAQLKHDEATISQLLTTVQSQSKVIDRFNQSVTNSDVVQRLDLLDKTLTQSEKSLQKELDETLDSVQHELADTMTKINRTITDAEKEISGQVNKVKKDFEQYVVKTEDQFSMENSFMVYQLAGTFTLLSCLISMWHMSAHLRKLNQPVIQRKILAILWMSPIYAITSWFSLVFPDVEGYLAIIKDAYEAYVIYQFLSFCIAVLGKGDRNKVVDVLARRADHLTPPFRLFFCCKHDPYENEHDLADAILLQCQFFALQFVFFRPFTTIAKVVLAKYEYFGPWGAEGPNDYRAPQFYVSLIQNLSIFIAFTGLLKFYHAVDKDLEWCRPFAKFLCIKGVVFMTFWQGLAITILAEMTDMGGNDAETWALSAQNFLICLEMLLFSIAHFYCFPTEEWEPDYRANFHKSKFGDSIALGDFLSDIKLIMKGNTKKKKKKQPSEPTVPEGDEENEETENGDDDEGGDDDDDIDEGDPEQGTEENSSVASDNTGSIINSNSEGREVEEARHRILQTGFLSDLLFMQPRDSSQGTSSETVSQDEAAQHSGASYGATDDDQWLSIQDTTSENTSLLSSATTPSTPLRPSIFTTIASISENEAKEETEGN